MNAETIRKNTLSNQKWLERALLALDKAAVWHNEADQKQGSYMVRWILKQKANNVPLGQRLTGDVWLGKARHLAQQYVTELMQLAYDKAKADAEYHAEQAKKAKQRASALKKELKAVLEKGPATPAPTT